MAQELTKAQLRDRTRALSNINSVGRLPEAEIDDRLVEVHDEWWTMERWDVAERTTVFTTVPGTADLTLPADAREVLEVTGRRGHLTHGGDRNGYTDRAGVITLTPVPETAEDLTVTYALAPPAFDTDTATPPYDPEFHGLYAYLAALRILAEKGGDARKVEVFRGRVFGDDNGPGYYQRMLRRHLHTSDRGPIDVWGAGRAAAELWVG